MTADLYANAFIALDECELEYLDGGGGCAGTMANPHSGGGCAHIVRG